MKSRSIILFGLVSLTLLSGCFGGGSDDSSGDPNSLLARSIINFTQNVTIPATTLNTASIKGILASPRWNDIPLIIGNGSSAVRLLPVSKTGPDGENNLVLRYSEPNLTLGALLAATGWTSYDPTRKVPFTIGYAGVPISGEMYIENRTTSDTTPDVTVNVIIKGSIVDGFTVSVTIVPPPDAPGNSPKLVTQPSAIPPSSLQNLFYVQSVTTQNVPNGVLTTVSPEAENPTVINATQPTFLVIFNTNTNFGGGTSWTASVKNLVSGSEFTLSEANGSLFTTQGAGNNVQITVKGGSGKGLSVGGSYRVRFMETNLSSTQGIGLPVPIDRFFRIQ